MAVLKLELNVYTIWTAVPPVAILIAYAIIVHRQDYFRLHPDRLGDNCYYMGFIFTLASLSFALIQLEPTIGNARASLLDSLIGSFGIALFSTIAGITLRVYFIQFRREIEDEEEQIRQELQAVATQLKDQLGLAVLDLEGFRIRTGQVLEQRLLASTEEFARVQQGIAEQAAAASQSFAAFHIGLERHVKTAASVLMGSTNDMTEGVNRIADAVKQVTARIDGIEAPPDLFSRHLRQAQTRINQLGTALERLTTSEEKRSEAFVQATNELLKQLAVLTETSRFSRLEGAAGQLEQRMTSLAAEVGALSVGVVSYQQAISGLVDGASHEKEALAALREAMQQDARNSVEALGALEATLSDIAHGVAARLS